MSCPLNKKKFLWIRYEGEHKYRYYNIKKQDNLWICTEHCLLCREWKWRTVLHTEMIRMGLIDRNGNIKEIVLTKEEEK